MAAIEKLLQQVKEGTLSIEEASLRLRKAPFVDLGYAQVDTQRGQRQGVPEVIYGAGKTTVLSSSPACPKKRPTRFKRPCPFITKRRGT